jgi:hydroxyethylthiazole kinase-like uncharacterized protein yjeF
MSSAPLHELLAANPLPPIDGDKLDRGVAVIVAGSEECPGAARLAATAALRVGAGKVQIVTAPAVAIPLGVAVPEALVVAWDPDQPPTERVKELATRADVVLVGPGLDAGSAAVARAVADHLDPSTPLLLDAHALDATRDLAGHRLVLLPNAAEASDLADGSRDRRPDVESLADELAASFGAVVAVRGESTAIAAREARWIASGHPGLGTAGSGDVLAGATTGFVARGLEPLAAIGWAVAAHAVAGRLASEACGGPSYGYMASDLVDRLPAAVGELEARLADVR